MSVGDAVLDGYKQTASWFDNGVEWLSDVADFYRERAAIEREASQKLGALTAKHFAKKANASAAVSVGDAPLTTPGSLENGSMQAWMATLNETEQIGKERRQLADELSGLVADELNALRSRFEDLGRGHKRMNEALEEHREKTTSHVKRAKHQYDSACESMETARAKGKKSADERETEMYRLKNQYLVQVNIGNRLKDKHYHDDLPELLDAVQRANEARVAQTNRLLLLANKIEKKRLANVSACLDASTKAVEANDPKLDSQMFVEHNANAFQWSDLPDFLFEPSPIWHDNDQMYIQSEPALRHLGALLGDANTQSVTLTAESQRAAAQYDDAKDSVIEAKFAQLTPMQAAPLLAAQTSTLKALVTAENRRVATEVEIEAIEAGTASVDMSHVPQTRIKTHRTLFGKKKEVVEVVDGAGQGHTNRALGLQSLLSRARISGGGGGGSGGGPQASMKYDFQAAGPGELSAAAGEVLELVQNDDGSGWVKLRGPAGEGLVPASYVDVLFGGMEAPSTAAAPPPPPSRGSKDPKMVALYAYDAADANQLSIAPNNVITVVEGDSGGWTTGVINGRQGIFPTAYARPM